MKRVLGLTGGVGSGKSTALAYLKARYGAALLLCDEIARTLQQKGGACYEPMRALLGDAFLAEDGNFDRAKLAKEAFSHPALLKQLNAIVHPAVFDRVKQQALVLGQTRLVVVEAALLIEGGYDRICDELWYIRTDPHIRARRLAQSRGYSKERIDRMLAAQKPDAFYEAHTSLTILNDGEDPALMYAGLDQGLLTHGFVRKNGNH